MNHVRIDSSYIVRSLRNIGLCVLCLFTFLLPVYGEEIGPYDNSIYGSNVEPLIAQFGLRSNASTEGGYYNGTYYRFRISSTSGSWPSNPTNELDIPVSVIYYTGGILFFFPASYSGNFYIRVDTSSDGFNWTLRNSISPNLTYTFVDGEATGTALRYCTGTSGYWSSARLAVTSADSGKIPVVATTNVSSILAVISSNSSYWPWDGSNSSGGRYWQDGTELDSEDVSKYSQIYLVMDSNNDNSVSEQEVNYYNYTYDTDYDYSVFNESNSFSEDQFLYWVAKQIDVGVENPGGGTGSGGSSSGGGINVTDSFSQTQTQTIEENAVNVTVNNNNSLTQENYQELNSLINNYNGSSEDETDPFQQAIGNFQAFHAIALAFAGLASVVFGWLPWWVTALLGAMFSMVCVFIVLRLIHLFK